MPREGAIIFRDLFGKLDVFNVECRLALNYENMESIISVGWANT